MLQLNVICFQILISTEIECQFNEYKSLILWNNKYKYFEFYCNKHKEHSEIFKMLFYSFQNIGKHAENFYFALQWTFVYVKLH